MWRPRPLVGAEIAPPSSAERGPDVGVFDFPAIRGRSGVVVGGDVAVLFAESAEDEAARELIRFLAKPEAARPWAEAGRFVSPNRKLSPSSYPDPTTRRLAETIVTAETVRFDLSDLVPPAFGAIEGQGMRQILRDYLKDPSEIEGVTQRLEEAASASDRLERAERARP